MNSNELNKRVMTIVQCTIEPLVTEYMQQHPEYFHDCVNSDGKICSFDITLSYQPKSLSTVADINAPSLTSVRLGDLKTGHELVKFDKCTSMESNWWINGDRHTIRTV